MGTADSDRSTSRGRVYVLMAVVAMLTAGLLALFASSQPDGLERVAQNKGFADSAQESPVSRSPLAGYTLGGDPAGQASPARSAAAGLAGVALMAGVAFGVFGLLGRRSPASPARPASTARR